MIVYLIWFSCLTCSLGSKEHVWWVGWSGPTILILWRDHNNIVTPWPQSFKRIMASVHVVPITDRLSNIFDSFPLVFISNGSLIAAVLNDITHFRFLWITKIIFNGSAILRDNLCCIALTTYHDTYRCIAIVWLWHSCFQKWPIPVIFTILKLEGYDWGLAFRYPF